MKKITNLAFLASILLWANTSDAMRGPLGGPLRFLGEQLGNSKSVSLKLKGASYSHKQSSIYSGNPTTGGEHKASSLVIKPSEHEFDHLENRPEDQAAS